jgi:hypothetical protein
LRGPFVHRSDQTIFQYPAFRNARISLSKK